MTKANIPGPRSQALVEQENQVMAPGLQSVALFSGIAVDRGEGCKIIDEDGNEYLDFIAGVGVGSVGHSHPHYVKTLKAQVDKITFGSFTTQNRARFLSLLASVTPKGLDRAQMFSGGAEAVEAALRLSKSVTGKYEFIAFWGGFHGKTGGVLGLLGDTFKHKQGPFPPGQHLTPYANCYRCPLKMTYPSCGIACAEYVRDVIRYETQGEIAAILIEPMQGTAGNVIPPDGFLQAIQEIAKENDALLIADEMLTGFGRSGKMWGCDHTGVVPDVMTVGKGIAGGFPVSALISSDELSSSKPFGAPSGSSSSYGGNPLASAASRAALEVILDEKLVENSERVGRAMLQRLEQMKQKYPFIGEVRGRGLMLGIELVKDRESKELLDKETTRALFDEALRRGLIAMCYNPIIRINPPLTITEDEALAGLDILDDAMAAVGKEAGLV